MARATPFPNWRAWPIAVKARTTKSAKSPRPATTARLLRPTVRTKFVITAFHIALPRPKGKWLRSLSAFGVWRVGGARLRIFRKGRARRLQLSSLTAGKAEKLPSRGPACGHVHDELRYRK